MPHPTITFESLVTQSYKPRTKSIDELITISNGRFYVGSLLAKQAGLNDGDLVDITQVKEHDRLQKRFAITKPGICKVHLERAQKNPRMAVYCKEAYEKIGVITAAKKFTAQIIDGAIIFEPIEEATTTQEQKGGEKNGKVMEPQQNFEFGKGNFCRKSRA